MASTPAPWYREQLSPDLVLASRRLRLLYTGRTPYQKVKVLETVPFGRMLVLDGKTQSSEADEFIYHESLVHPAMVSHERPRTIFIGGGGEGATLREVLRHPSVERVVMVDLDRRVVEVCKEHLPNHHQGAFGDPRLELHYTDARVFLEQSEERYDVVIMDLADPLEGGPAYLLYTQEFYRLVQSRLTPQGVMVTQAGFCGPNNHKDVFTPVYRTISTVFRAVAGYTAFIASFGGVWGFVLGAQEPSAIALSPEEIDRRLAGRLTAALRYYDGITHKGSCALPKYVRQSLAAERRVVTEANPVFAP